jgi:hypothetical protein
MTDNGMCWPDDEDEVVRPAGELPVAVQMEWTKAWDRETANSFNEPVYRVTWADGAVEIRPNSFNEPVYRVTWADGAVEIRHSIRNEWHAIKPLGDPKVLDAKLDDLSRGDKDFRPVPTTLDEATAYGLDRIIRTVRRVA